MRIIFSVLLELLLALLQGGAAGDSVIEFENRWVRIVRVHYNAHEKTAVHDHPAQPTVFVYVTDGGRLKIGHDGEAPTVRPPVKAGGIRFQKGVTERHFVEEMDGVESEYVRVELKTKAIDLPEADVRRPPSDRAPYEGGMIRIERVTCAPHSRCPPSENPSRPAVIVTGSKAVWVVPNAEPLENSSDSAMEQVRVELKTQPVR